MIEKERTISERMKAANGVDGKCQGCGENTKVFEFKKTLVCRSCLNPDYSIEARYRTESSIADFANWR